MDNPNLLFGVDVGPRTQDGGYEPYEPHKPNKLHEPNEPNELHELYEPRLCTINTLLY